MSPWLPLRRRVGRWLPARLKSALRRVLPARLTGRPPVTRRFWLTMPVPPAGLGGSVRVSPVPRRVRFEAPGRSYVPRLLAEGGVAQYEPETIAAFLASISTRGASEAFDIGANAGIFSIVAAATTTTRITGFEPTPALASTFRGIVQANGLTCQVEELALGASTGTATLYVSAKTDSSNSLRAGFRPAAGSIEVPLERLDDYVTRSGRRPEVMKIDTETTEPDVLAGAIETLRDGRPWIVCEVLAGTTEAALMSILRPLGYRFHHLSGASVPIESLEIEGDPTYLHRDWLFTPGTLPEAFAAHYVAWITALQGAV
ncbi:MAG: FkbM family methyltransferase [Chloroflexota bacterium]